MTHECENNIPRGRVIFEVDCEHCSFRGWTPGDGAIYPYPVISNSTGMLEESISNEFLRRIHEQPLRTRLNLIVEDWNITEHHIDRRLNAINAIANNFGLAFHRLHNAEDIKSEEPLLLTTLLQNPSLRDGIAECADQSPQGSSRIDENFETMMERLDRLRDRLQESDINERNRPASLGLKERQYETIKTVLKKTGSLTIGALPTGYGKTRIAQAASLCLRKQGKGPILMISPLISLMDDQRAQWETFSADIEDTDLATGDSKGFRGKFLTTAETEHPMRMMRMMKADEIDILCCSPETLLSSPRDRPMWINRLTSLENPVSMLVIDEAHIVGDWGASIRPEFQLLGWVKDRLLHANPDLRVLLLSATISGNEETELTRLFNRGLQRNPTIRIERTRPDLYFHLEIQEMNEDGFDFSEPITRLHNAYNNIPVRWFEDQVRANYRPPSILYTPKKVDAEGIVSQIARTRFNRIQKYTGGTSNIRREQIRLDFINNEFECLIATSAFGMGIDKPDVWISSYLGMPFTVKGLYQGFGRAARNSRWDDDQLRRNGVCFGVIPDSNPRRFRAQLGKPKSLERMYDLFFSNDTVILENGYVLLPIYSNIEFAAWRPLQEIVEDVEHENDEDSTDDYMSHCWIDTGQSEEEGYLEEFRRAKRFEALYSMRMWVIACLNRTPIVEFLGIHRELLLSANSQDQHPIRLADVLSDQGYDGVMEHLRQIPDGYKRNVISKKYAVLRFNRYIDSWSDLAGCLVQGHEILRERHGRGREELRQFIEGVKEGVCLRILFAPAIGAAAQDSSCSDLDGRVMPCSNCRGEFGMHGDDFLWSTEEFMFLNGWNNQDEMIIQFHELDDNGIDNLFMNHSDSFNLNQLWGQMGINPRVLNLQDIQNFQPVFNVEQGEYPLYNKAKEEIGRIICTGNGISFVGESEETVTQVVFFDDVFLFQ